MDEPLPEPESAPTITITVHPYVARALGFDHLKPSTVSTASLLERVRQMKQELPQTAERLALKISDALALLDASLPTQPTPVPVAEN